MTEVEAIEKICNAMERLGQNDELIQRQITALKTSVEHLLSIVKMQRGSN